MLKLMFAELSLKSEYQGEIINICSAIKVHKMRAETLRTSHFFIAMSCALIMGNLQFHYVKKDNSSII
ncbi:hypothetical protein A9G37_09960 [Gilliamella sp. GillExp13]|nr:hypothetical protein A9G37_09960 [Gilliamella apicola]